MNYREELAKKRNGWLKDPPKEKTPMKKVSDKKAAEMKEAGSEGNKVKEKWFAERRKEMTGKCLFCEGPTEKANDATFRNSIGHILPKKEGIGGLPSVAYHADNWIELCFYGNSCHQNFDSGMITWEFLRDSAEWKVIVDKFKRIYPCIAESERKYIPEILLQEIKQGI